MTEPNVDFELAGIEDSKIREMFDQVRRWFDFRDDVKTPAMQTFSGILAPGTSIVLYVPGVVVGWSGMTEYSGGYWAPMYFSTTNQVSRLYFGLDTGNVNGSSVKILSDPANARALGYRVTLMYRDE